MSEDREFDVVVIGAGPAGEVAAGRCADGGKRAAIVERELIGGECSYWACMPSKALLRPAEALAEAQRVPGAAQAATGELDTAAVLRRRDEVIHDLDDAGQLPWLEDRGIELIRGEGRLAGDRTVVVGDMRITAGDAVIIAVGSGALMPPIDGLAEAAAWSNREIVTAKAVPESLVILGGGVVGVEMAQAWTTLGSHVTVIEAGERLISREEPIASEELQAALERRGVDVRIGHKADSVRREGGAVTVNLEGGEAIRAEHLLVAIGRKPHTEGLGLESIGLPGEGYVEVDERMRVAGHPWLYAIGDANGRALLTHAGKYQARIAADNVLGRDGVAWADAPGPPRVIFTEPQIAACGRTLAQATEAGLDAVAIDVSTQGTAGASFYGKGVDGTTRFVVDRSRRVLIGATFVGPDTAEFVHAATVAVVGEVPLAKLAHAIPSFPSRSELWLSFIDKAEEQLGASLHASG